MEEVKSRDGVQVDKKQAMELFPEAGKEPWCTTERVRNGTSRRLSRSTQTRHR